MVAGCVYATLNFELGAVASEQKGQALLDCGFSSEILKKKKRPYIEDRSLQLGDLQEGEGETCSKRTKHKLGGPRTKFALSLPSSLFSAVFATKYQAWQFVIKRPKICYLTDSTQQTKSPVRQHSVGKNSAHPPPLQ